MGEQQRRTYNCHTLSRTGFERACMRVLPVQAPRNRARAGAMRAFRQLADDTNDIFHLAAQVIAHTILHAERLLGGGGAAAGGVLLPHHCVVTCEVKAGGVL